MAFERINTFTCGTRNRDAMAEIHHRGGGCTRAGRIYFLLLSMV